MLRAFSSRVLPVSSIRSRKFCSCASMAFFISARLRSLGSNATANSLRLSTRTACAALVAIRARLDDEAMFAAPVLSVLSALTPSHVIPAASADKRITTARILGSARKRARNDMGVSDRSAVCCKECGMGSVHLFHEYGLVGGHCGQQMVEIDQRQHLAVDDGQTGEEIRPHGFPPLLHRLKLALLIR